MSELFLVYTQFMSSVHSSEEPLICEECGQVFDTVESLGEHRQTERQENELRNKGIDD